jgi:hypothetical protein
MSSCVKKPDSFFSIMARKSTCQLPILLILLFFVTYVSAGVCGGAAVSILDTNRLRGASWLIVLREGLFFQN